MDPTQELRDTENALRDFIAAVLSRELGSEWVSQLGVTPERIAEWEKRKATEATRQRGGTVEERLLYYADFYELRPILKKHWNRFTVALGDLKTIEVFLKQLEALRDPDAHRRELLPHQKHLILGIGGEIRTRIVRHRSTLETTHDYFPRFESVRDSLGNIWVPGGPLSDLKCLRTPNTLRPGDLIDVTATATDPMGGRLEFKLDIGHSELGEWQSSPAFRVRIEDRHIRSSLTVEVLVRSDRAYHAAASWDDLVSFVYTVLPCDRG